MIFRHTSAEPGLWRGWLHNGQSVEVSWGGNYWKFGAGVLIHSNDDDQGDRMLAVSLWKLSVYFPLGIVRKPYQVGDEPQWSAFGYQEEGLWLHWGAKRKGYDWPFALFTVSYEQQLADGEWVSVFDNDAKPNTEAHPYRYVLQSGEEQNRTATVSKRRHVLSRRGLHWLGWPVTIKESIDVNFDAEVGERTGSWKGGCTGCGYDLRPGETMLQSLRRMEAERKF